MSITKLLLFLQMLYFSMQFLSCSKILMVLPLGSKSHKNIFTPLAEKLAVKGHNVAVVSAYAEEGNRTLLYRDIVASNMAKKRKRIMGDFSVIKMIEEKGASGVNRNIMKQVIINMPYFCEMFIRDPKVKEAWSFKPDIILLPAFMNECGLIFVERFKVPFIYVTTSGLTPWTADLVGNPEHPAFVPNQYLAYDDDMNLFERAINLAVRIVSPILRRYMILSRLDAVAQKFLQDPSVSLQNIENNVSLVLVNSHHSLSFPRPLQPNVIEVGGMHCRDAQPIEDEDLSLFLNSSMPNSVILFSLGSHMKSSDLSQEKKNMFVKAFSRLPYKVVWKWEEENITGLSDNVLIKKWLPQQNILGHPAVGGFLTHGGLLSLQETIYHGVPMVGLPMFGDQPNNVKQAEKTGISLSLQFESLTEEKIFNTLTKMMTSKSMKRKIQMRSAAMKDQETKPLDRAAYYTEYVIRHKGAKHLKSTAASLSVVQYFFLDVISLGILCLYLCYKVLSMLTLHFIRILKKIKNLPNFLLKFYYSIHNFEKKSKSE